MKPSQAETWPALPYEAWAETKATLHRYCQILGKVRLALTPPRNHWWHVTLQVGARGLTTGPMPCGGGRFAELALDLIDQQLVLQTSDGGDERFALADGLSCADFYQRLFAALDRLGVAARIWTRPFDLPGPRLDRDRQHDRWDAQAVARYFEVLRRSTEALWTLAGDFVGKQSPAHLFWHSLDLAMARFSGRRAPERHGADPVTREAYSHEVIAFGFWPGDAKVPFPAYYAYAAPARPGLTERTLWPEAAWWDHDAGTAYLKYDDVRASRDPQETLLAFWRGAYLAGAETSGWDLSALRR